MAQEKNVNGYRPWIGVDAYGRQFEIRSSHWIREISFWIMNGGTDRRLRGPDRCAWFTPQSYRNRVMPAFYVTQKARKWVCKSAKQAGFYFPQPAPTARLYSE